MNDSRWTLLLPWRIRVALVVFAFGLATVAVAPLTPAIVWSHPAFHSPAWLGRASAWYIKSPLPGALYRGGWALMLLGLLLILTTPPDTTDPPPQGKMNGNEPR